MKVIVATSFKKQAKDLAGKDKDLLLNILALLKENAPLPQKYHEHPLIGNYRGFLEAHIRPDLLIIYKKTEDSIYLYKIGSHSKLFR